MLRGEGIIQNNENGRLIIQPANITGSTMMSGYNYPLAAAIANSDCPLVGTENLFKIGFDPRNHLDEIDTVKFTARELLFPALKTVGLILISVSGEKCKDCQLTQNCRVYQNSEVNRF